MKNSNQIFLDTLIGIYHVGKKNVARGGAKNGNQQLNARTTIGIGKSILPVPEHRATAIPIGRAAGTTKTQATITDAR